MDQGDVGVATGAEAAEVGPGLRLPYLGQDSPVIVNCKVLHVDVHVFKSRSLPFGLRGCASSIRHSKFSPGVARLGVCLS